jgi:hypothetical protein
MGDLIRFVSSHEVGHTIATPQFWFKFDHSSAGKFAYPAWIAAHGHTPSICIVMLVFNYVAQPEDGVKDLYPRIA